MQEGIFMVFGLGGLGFQLLDETRLPFWFQASVRDCRGIAA